MINLDEVEREARIIRDSFEAAMNQALRELRENVEESGFLDQDCNATPANAPDPEAAIILNAGMVKRILSASEEVQVGSEDLIKIILGQGLREIEVTGAFLITGHSE